MGIFHHKCPVIIIRRFRDQVIIAVISDFVKNQVKVVPFLGIVTECEVGHQIQYSPLYGISSQLQLLKKKYLTNEL